MNIEHFKEGTMFELDNWKAFNVATTMIIISSMEWIEGDVLIKCYIPEDMKYVTLYLDEFVEWYKNKQLRILM